MLNNELRRVPFDCCSGVSSLSATSGEDKFSPPDDKSTSNFRGVVNAGCPKTDAADWSVDCCRCGENRKEDCEFGGRRVGMVGFPGESKI